MLHRAIQVGKGVWNADGQGWVATWPVRIAGRRVDLRTEVQGTPSAPEGAPVPEAAVAAVLLPAMQKGRGVRIEHLASKRFVEAQPRLQTRLRELFPKLRPAAVKHTDVAEVEAREPEGSGIFLSLGIDSFYSLLRLRRNLSDLVLVRGFDARLEDDERWQATVESAEEVAAWTDTRLLQVRTNVRELIEPHVAWNMGLGAALAHVGLVLTPWMRRITIPSSQHADPYFAHGSHPELDGLWSTEWLEVVHHGHDVRRLDTLAYVAREKVAMDHLRVCREGDGGNLNCGRCARCLLAMLGLHVVEGLSGCRTLPHEFADDAVRAVERWSLAERVELEAVHDAWRELRPGTQVLEEVRAALRRALEAEPSS